MGCGEVPTGTFTLTTIQTDPYQTTITKLLMSFDLACGSAGRYAGARATRGDVPRRLPPEGRRHDIGPRDPNLGEDGGLVRETQTREEVAYVMTTLPQRNARCSNRRSGLLFVKSVRPPPRATGSTTN